MMATFLLLAALASPTEPPAFCGMMYLGDCVKGVCKYERPLKVVLKPGLVHEIGLRPFGWPEPPDRILLIPCSADTPLETINGEWFNQEVKRQQKENPPKP